MSSATASTAPPPTSSNCMAANGGTGEPIYAAEQAGADRCPDGGILSEIREEASAFASAAVPQVQANATDKIFLSSFTPIGDAGFWAGRMDAFLKPLPLDRSRAAGSLGRLRRRHTKASCFLWDAGDVQEGLGAAAAASTTRRACSSRRRIRTTSMSLPPFDADRPAARYRRPNERRVVYTQFSEPGNRRLFTYPTTNCPEVRSLDRHGNRLHRRQHRLGDRGRRPRQRRHHQGAAREGGHGPDPDGIRHHVRSPTSWATSSTPTRWWSTSRPISPTTSSDPYLNKPLCAAARRSGSRSRQVSYKWFADRHVCRRTLLLTGCERRPAARLRRRHFPRPGSGTAECLLPAKDLDGDGIAEVDECVDGVIDYDLDDDVESELENKHVLDGAYDNGTGREVFSFIPRAMLADGRKTWSKGRIATRGLLGNRRQPAGRRRVHRPRWPPRTARRPVPIASGGRCALGGYREGGPGYYALDITQPDTLDADHVPQPTAGYTPSCFDGGGACGNRPYPSVLWEFQDRQPVAGRAGISSTMELDEDLNGDRDLGNSWSKTDDRQDPRLHRRLHRRRDRGPLRRHLRRRRRRRLRLSAVGNFIYMVDIETGKVIYKKAVIGAVPADIAADRLERRLLHRPALLRHHRRASSTRCSSTPRRRRCSSRARPSRRATAGVNYNFTAERLIGPAGDPKRYDPFQVFSTGGRPIYQEIAAIYVATQGPGRPGASAPATAGICGTSTAGTAASTSCSTTTSSITDRDGVLNYQLRRLHPAA